MGSEVSLSDPDDLGAAARPDFAELSCCPPVTRGTLTTRTLGSSNETQLPSDRPGLTQNGCTMSDAPCSLAGRGSTAAYPTAPELAVGIVSARDTGSLGAIATSDLLALGGAIMAAPIPTTTRHASANQRRRLEKSKRKLEWKYWGAVTGTLQRTYPPSSQIPN
jgi:hypothetical protein